VAIACALAGCGSTALAESTLPSSPVLVDSVYVTGEAADPLNVPAAVERIDRDGIARAQPRLNLAESLPRVPGVLARDRHNQAQDIQISIRGFGARSTFGVRGVQLYSDGIPATIPDGQGQVSHFVLDATDRIEVLRGPFTALYGNSAGGVIQVLSADPPAHTEVRVGPIVGGSGWVRGALGLSGPWPGHRAGGYAFAGSTNSDDGFRDHSASDRTDGQVLLKGGSDGATRWIVVGNGIDAHADDPQGLTAAEVAADPEAASPGALTFDTRKSTRQQQLGGRLEQPIAGSSLLGLVAHLGSRQIEQFLSVPVAAQSNPLSGGGVVDLDRDYWGLDGRWRLSNAFRVNGLALTAGFEQQVSDEHRRGYENFVGSELGVKGALRRDEDDRVRGSDEYAQLEWTPASRWHAHVGVRHSGVHFQSRDHYVTADNPDDSGELDFSDTTPVGGLLWRTTPWMSLYAIAGEGFETPTFSELSYRDDGTSGLNTDLLPAESNHVELGVRARRDRTSFGVAGFYARTDDELIVASSSGGRTTYTNAPGSLRRGAEVSGAIRWSQWRGTVAYTYLDAYFREAFGTVEEGNQIPGTVRHNGFAELEWLPGWGPGDGLNLALSAMAVDRVWADDANTASAAGYALFDLSAEESYGWSGILFTGFVRVRNLFDREVVGSVIVNEANGRYYEPSPGRTWVAGISTMLVPGR
jgi:iron complex outermembrane receptor protein